MDDKYRALIKRDFPNFEIRELKYLGSGWDNAAVLVNGQYVFRFLRGLFDPSYPLKKEDIEKEVNVLSFLEGKVSFDVPKPNYVAADHSFFGYKLISGTLWDQADDQLSEAYLREWIRVRTEISAAIKPSTASGLKVPQYRTGKNEQLVKQYIASPEADERVKGLAQAAMDYVCTRCTPQDSWVFVHEDLQMSNCMVNPQSKTITGVIDWLEAEIGPAEAEFYFWSKYGNGLLEKMAELQRQYDGTEINVELARAIHQFYIVADYQDYRTRGFDQAAAHKWRQIEAYL